MGKGSGESESNVFIRDPEFAWIPCVKIGGDANKAKVRVPQYPDEQSIVCDCGASAKSHQEEEVLLKNYHKGVLPMQNVKGGQLTVFEDMVELPFLHEVSTYNIAAGLATKWLVGIDPGLILLNQTEIIFNTSRRDVLRKGMT